MPSSAPRIYNITTFKPSQENGCEGCPQALKVSFRNESFRDHKDPISSTLPLNQWRVILGQKLLSQCEGLGTCIEHTCRCALRDAINKQEEKPLPKECKNLFENYIESVLHFPDGTSTYLRPSDSSTPFIEERSVIFHADTPIPFLDGDRKQK